MSFKTGNLPLAAFTIALTLAAAARAQDSVDVKYKGAAWFQGGRVMNSTDSLVNGGGPNNMNGNWIEAAGVQVSSVAKLSPKWEGAMGMGALQTHNARGDISVANNWYPYWVTFVSEARLTYTLPIAETQKLQVNLGFFPYNYNPDVKDLGLYLLRGYVYPGAPISGFEARGTTPAANIFGAMASYSLGTFKYDQLLISETDNRPYFDGSIAGVLTWTPGAAFQMGLGYNLYRSIARDPDNTSPGKDCKNEVSGYAQIDPDKGKGFNEICYVLDTLVLATATDSAKVDTVLGSLAGTKVMARARLDFKALLGLEGGLGKQDLVLYGELGVLGIEDRKKYYTDIKRRMPLMVGFNLPAFGFADKFSIEVEYYASKNFADYGKSETSYSWVPRVVPEANNGRDDIKWALYYSKIVMGHLRLSGQIANDHLRMFGPPDIGFLSYAETLTTPKDWYLMFKSTYFF
jgi:hypothetical protein